MLTLISYLELEEGNLQDKKLLDADNVEDNGKNKNTNNHDWENERCSGEKMV